MFRQSKRRALERNNNFGEDVVYHTDYPHRLNFYLVPPLQEITLEEFEMWAIDRIKVLGEVERAQVNNSSADELEKSLKPILQDLMPLSFTGPLIESERKKDHYSHFILKLAFCRSDELRSKFVNLETALFKYRFTTDNSEDRKKFINSLELQWESVSEEEQNQLQPFLIPSNPQRPDPNETYFKVDFERVCDLVEYRRVFIKDGKAYVPTSLQLSLVLAEYSQRLEKSLIITARALPRLDEDQRLIPILSHLSTGFSWSSYTGSNHSEEGFTAESIGSLDKEGHFPLCMQRMFKGLQVNQHAKYDTRQQFGLFIKGIGLSLEQSLIFWRMMFKKVDEEKFQKDYVYNIKHTYGMVGGKKNYKPYQCSQIIQSNPGPGQTHGCPYKEYSAEKLTDSLKQMGITDEGELASICNMSKERRYNIACTKVYELTHGGDRPREIIAHPNAYFDSSYSYSKSGSENTSQIN